MVRTLLGMDTLSKGASALSTANNMAIAQGHLGADYERVVGPATMIKSIPTHALSQFQISDQLAAAQEQYCRSMFLDSVSDISRLALSYAPEASLKAFSDALELETVAKERALGLSRLADMPDYMKGTLDALLGFDRGQLGQTVAKAFGGATISGVHDAAASLTAGLSNWPATVAELRSYIDAIGSQGFAQALTQSLASIEKDYSKAFFGISNQIRAEALTIQGFDAATLTALTGSYGREQIDAQLLAMGLDPAKYLDSYWNEDTAEEETSQAHKHAPLVPRSLADARHMVQVLLWHVVAGIIVETLLAYYGWHPHIDKLTERTTRIEQLLNDLPTVLEPIVERALRRELSDHRVSYVVRDRTARLRALPESGSTTIATIFPNQVVTFLGESGKWIKVEFYDYARQEVQEGWVLKKYLQRLPELRTPQPAPR